MGFTCPRHGQVSGVCRLPPISRWMCPLKIDKRGYVVGLQEKTPVERGTLPPK